MKDEKQKVVTIGGGSGQFALLSGLRDLEEIEISSVVSMVDSGGSTGRLRDECWINRTIYASDLLDIVSGIVRHNSKKLALLIKEIMSQNKE
jgi:2-phospho-L-lactate transferase/gluconeogenesis factor (CofD/UPF0052 family)